MKNKTLTLLAAAMAVSCVDPKTELNCLVPETFREQVEVMCPALEIDTLMNPEKGSLTIELPVNKMITASVRYGARTSKFILDGSRVNVDFTSAEGPVYATGGDVNDAYSAYLKWRADYRKRYQQASSQEESDRLMNEYEEKMRELSVHGNALGLLAVKNLKPLIGPSEMRELVDGLSPVLKENESIVAMLETLWAQEATAPGRMFTDFEIKQPDGSVKKLSDYVGKGKYILADFWASWCVPCRYEIPNIKKVYDRFRGDGFDVVSVAVWDKPENTLKAIEEEGMEWPQIINCQKVPSELYGIEGIPELILFAPDGTIVERGAALRGARLESSISEHLR